MEMFGFYKKFERRMIKDDIKGIICLSASFIDLRPGLSWNAQV